MENMLVKVEARKRDKKREKFAPKMEGKGTFSSVFWSRFFPFSGPFFRPEISRLDFSVFRRKTGNVQYYSKGRVEFQLLEEEKISSNIYYELQQK